MTQSRPNPSDERIVDAMIQLARAAKSHRMIAAGPYSAEVFLELHRRGYPRVTTIKTSRVPCGQYDVALVAWRAHSIKALETTLDWLVHFLSAAGVLVIWVGPHERMPNQTLSLALKRLGFRIESGTSCENGVAIAARRLDSVPAAKAA
jgi:hypothetical protein